MSKITKTQEKVLKHLQAGSIIETSCDYHGAWISGNSHNDYKISNHTLMALKHLGIVYWSLRGKGFLYNKNYNNEQRTN